MRVVILGSTGYAGMMLVRILVRHPDVASIVPVSRSAAGTAVRESDPGIGPSAEALFGETGGCYVAPEKADGANADVILSALPHGAAARLLGPFVGSIPVIDLSADFRISSAERYESIYGTEHPYPELIGHAVYGLTEWHRDEIASAAIVACPGCYPTATLLPLLPFADLVQSPIVVNALSGISGAGRKEKRDLLFCERSENLTAYNPGRVHRHVPEIEQELAASAPGTPEILFTPHLVPVKQGMIVTTVAALTHEISQEDAESRLRSAYGDAPFVGLSPRGIPESRDVRNSNRCDLGVAVHGRHVQLFSALDNLYKGAAGQGVQNMNIRMGLDERLGLSGHGEF